MSSEQGGEGGGGRSARLAAVLRSRMADGTYALGSKLPAQRELADEFGVSRDTVQRALGELQNEGWIASRQGSGSTVLKDQRIDSPAVGKWPDRKVTLGRLIGQAFQQSEVTLDVFTLTAESLDSHIRYQGELIQAGEIRPESVALRVLLPTESVELPYWRSDDPHEDVLLKDRFVGIMRRSTETLRSVMSQLKTSKLVPSVHFEIRRVKLAPTFKLYLVNNEEALHGFYEIVIRPIELEGGRQITTADVEGVAARLTHHVKDPQSQGAVFLDGMQKWFNSAWEGLGIPEKKSGGIP
ncbi:GntR family transcriptional regulator [Streptomyces sp. NPDC002766]|uniref:GntR family transcriptional regulator n=1 Tax=unclassified Streptomyces TaxID=2593676 RepID=UPI0033209D88